MEEPRRTWLRKLYEEPKCKNPNTETAIPILAAPNSDTLEPIFAKLLNDMEEPTFKK
jgi:hypothetical protein